MNRDLQAVFIDRDGTIGGTGHFIHPKDFKVFSYTSEAIRLLKVKGLKVFAFTNQHRIARGEAVEEDFIEEFNKLGFDDSYICPHSSKAGCNCHKPKSGMLITAAKEYKLDLSKCVVIGDVGSTDMLAAEKMRCIKVLVKTGWGEDSLGRYRHTWEHTEPDFVADNLLEAVKWVTS